MPCDTVGCVSCTAPTARASQGENQSTGMKLVGAGSRLRLPPWLGDFLPF